MYTDQPKMYKISLVKESVPECICDISMYINNNYNYSIYCNIHEKVWQDIHSQLAEKRSPEPVNLRATHFCALLNFFITSIYYLCIQEKS